jgi:hypothetical protein
MLVGIVVRFMYGVISGAALATAIDETYRG